MLTAEPWDEDKTLFRYILYLAARSYEVEQLFQVPAARPENGNRDYVLSPRKNVCYRNVLHLEHHPLPLNMNGRKGIVCWTDRMCDPSID